MTMELEPTNPFIPRVDLVSVQSYTRQAREYLALSTAQRGSAVEAIHFLLGSKELALGVSAFKGKIGAVPIHTYFDRASFVQSYAAAAHDAVGGGREARRNDWS